MTRKLEELKTKFRDLEGREDSPEKVDELIAIAEELISGDDPEMLVEVTTTVREISRRLAYPHGEAYGLLYEGLRCCFFAQHEEGLTTINESKSMFEEMGDDFGIAKTALLEANLLRSIGSFDQALPNFFKALAYFKSHGLHSWEAGVLYDLGLLHLEIGDHQKALEYFTGCTELLEVGAEKGAAESTWISARSLNGMGTSLNNLGKHEEAIEHHHRALSIFKELGHRMGEARALDDIGQIYLQMDDHELALPFHKKSLEIRKSIGQRRAESTSLTNIARVHLAAKDAGKALEVLEEALAIAEETKSTTQIYSAHQLMSEALEMQGRYPEALDHYKRFQRIKEGVFNDQTSSHIQRLRVGFEVEKAEKEAEIERLKNVELRETNEQLEMLLKELRATQSQLVQSEKMAVIGKVAAGMVHEMNTPLGATNGAIDVCERCIDKIAELQAECKSIDEFRNSGELQSLYERIRDAHRVARDAAERVSNIVGRLKSFSHLDRSDRQTVDIHEGLESTLALLEPEFRDRIDVVRNYGAVPAVYCWPGEMNQVFMNLLTNAIESVSGKGMITIGTSLHNGHVHIEIADNGAGIPADQLETLFDPGFRKKGPRVKAGLGLMVCLSIVQKHGGRIDVASEVGKGTTFTVVLPARSG